MTALGADDSGTRGPDPAIAESLTAAIHERVRLHPYDERWPIVFGFERDRLIGLLPDAFVAIEHFGSTAVPGMVAKPIVDLLAGVRSMAAADAVTRQLLDASYTTSAEFNATLLDRRWFMRATGGHRTHHLHVVVHGGAAWQERLAFRDALRADPPLAARYGALKQALAIEFETDREAYTAAKAEFVRTALRGR